jgi:hypothetical protein
MGGYTAGLAVVGGITIWLMIHAPAVGVASDYERPRELLQIFGIGLIASQFVANGLSTVSVKK